MQQINSVAGGVVVLVFGHGPAGLPDIGDVLFVPVGASEAGPARLIAHANYMAVAPNRRDVWVEQVAPPWGNGPASSPTWLVGEDGPDRDPAAAKTRLRLTVPLLVPSCRDSSSTTPEMIRNPSQAKEDENTSMNSAPLSKLVTDATAHKPAVSTVVAMITGMFTGGRARPRAGLRGGWAPISPVGMSAVTAASSA